MAQTNLSPQLQMLRPHLRELDPVRLPEDYVLRSFQPGDAPAWAEILADSFGGTVERFSFDAIMRSDVAFRPERVFFICQAGRPIATASAYNRAASRPGAGMLHYVGVCAAHRGKRLGCQVSLAALHRMAAEGLTAAWLSTDDFRLPAIKTYLQLGFEPLLIHENQRERWRAVFEALSSPRLCRRLLPLLDGELWSAPQHPADMCRYSEALRRRRRWHPGRPVGTRARDDVASRDDESLYRPSQLGTAGAEPATVSAGENRPLEFWFRVGPAGLPTGSEVRFHCAGQRPLGCYPQTDDPAKPGYLEVVAAPPHTRLERVWIGFRVAEGALGEGDEVRLAIGRRGGMPWTPLAGRKDVQVIVETHPTEPKMRLPEPVAIRVQPLAADHVDVFLPLSARPGEPVEASLTVRDRHDNRVPCSGVAAVTVGGQRHTAYLSGGFGRVSLGPMGAQPLRASAALADLGLDAASNVCLPAGAHQLYIGDMHAHDLNSEAEGYTAEAYRWAIEDKRLDFLSLSVQCHNYLDNEKWHLAKHMAEAFLDEGRFVSLLGFEWQHSQYGDKIVHFMGGDAPFLPIDDARYAHPSGLYEALRGTDAFVISHHPGYATGQWVPGTDYAAMETDVDRCLELWSMHGSSEGHDADDRPVRAPRRAEGVMAALRAGLRVGLVAGSDTHTARPGGSAKEPMGYWGGLCAVWAERLTRRALFEAFMARRTYALTGARIALRFTVNGAPMGAELPAADRAEIRIEAWAPGRIRRVELLKDTRVCRVFEPADDHAVIEAADATGGRAFYHARVTLDDGHLAVCTPVWIG